MYIRNLDGAKPPIFKTVDILCPPDCGGAYDDEIEYAPFCPVCNRRFKDLERDKFCRDCGTKLFWNVKRPEFM